MKPIVSFYTVIYFFFSCANNANTGSRREEPQETTYADYQVWAEEGREDVTVRVQYRQGGVEGDPIVLQEPSSILLDGQELTPDSTKFMGAFYEVSKPAIAFKGNHTLVFVDEAKKEHRENFSFEPFTLAEELPENVKMKPFQIQLQDFPEEATTVRLVITDTSHVSEDVNEEIIVENGRVDVTSAYLANLTKGPVVFELYREEEKQLGWNGLKKGKFTMTYGLKRKFNLFK